MLGIVTYGVIKEAQVLCTGLDVLVVLRQKVEQGFLPARARERELMG